MNRLRSPMRRDAATAGGAAMDGDELAEDVAGADHEPCRPRPCISGPAAPGQSTRTETPRCRRRSWCGRRSPPMRRSVQLRPMRTSRTDHRKGADARAFADHRIGMHARAAGRSSSATRRIDDASTSVASATGWPSTSATPRALTSGPRAAPRETSSFSRSPGTTCLRNLAPSTPRSCTRRRDRRSSQRSAASPPA